MARGVDGTRRLNCHFSVHISRSAHVAATVKQIIGTGGAGLPSTSINSYIPKRKQGKENLESVRPLGSKLHRGYLRISDVL